MLRDALERSAVGADRLRFAAPEPLLSDAADALARQYGRNDKKRQPSHERAALLQRLRRVDYDWDRVAIEDRLKVAWVLWDGPLPPAEHAAFLRAFLDWLDKPWRRIQASRLAASWATAFDPEIDSIQVVGEWLAARAGNLLAPWDRFAAELGLFSVAEAPARLARALLAAGGRATTFAEEIGYAGDPAANGLVLEALATAASLVEETLAEAPRLAAGLVALSMHRTVFRPDTARPRRAGAVRGRLAEALLLPWRHAAPPTDVKDAIRDWLLRHYGDVRIADARWRDIDRGAIAVMRQWLKETTVASFFRLRGTPSVGDAPSQRAQREFWLSSADRLDDIWLVAGTRGQAAVRATGIGCGRLVGCRSDDSAMLVKANGVTIVTTSYSGDVLVWRKGNALAPLLEMQPDRSYWPAALSAGADSSLNWSRVARAGRPESLDQFIERHTGLVGAAPANATGRQPIEEPLL